MNIDIATVCGVPGMPDGQVTATIADGWLDAESGTHVVQLARRVERLQRKAAKRLAEACAELDEALQDHPLEMRLRTRLLWPLQRDCDELNAVSERVRVRLSLFAPAQSQQQFERGMALQLEDIRAEDTERAEEARAAKPSAPPMPFGYWMSEESFNRLERACSAALLLGSMGAGIGESMAIPFDAVAASANYVHQDLAAVVADATHSSELAVRDESR